MPQSCPRCGLELPEDMSVCPACGLPHKPVVVCRSCTAHVRKDDEVCWTCGAQLDRQLHCWHCGSKVWTYSVYCSSCGAPQPDLAQLLTRTAESDENRLPFPNRRKDAQPASRSAPPESRPQARPPEALRPASKTQTQAEPAQPVPAPAPPEADRLKIVTVLFADVSGFTSMSEDLDPEEVKDIMNACFAGLTEEITSRGGTVDKYIGDCVMALFGAPVTREDDPERAIETALGMQAFLKEFSGELQEKSGIDLSMRVGINTGKVLAGFVGHGECQDFTVMGDAVNLASRLEHACPVGSILVSYETYRMVRGLFRVRHLEPIQVKGKAEPVRVVEVLGRRPRSVELTEPTFRGVPTRIIGREREKKQLNAAFTRVQYTGKPMLVTVRAPMGMGKSRLIHDFASWILGETDHELDFLRCRDYRTESTYAPLIEKIDGLLGTAGHENPDTLRSRTHDYLGKLGLEGIEHQRVEAAFAHLLGVPAEQVPGLRAFAHDPEQLEGVVREGILTFYRTRAKKGPIVLAIEDMQGASVPFLDLLATLTSIKSIPLLLVMTYRPDADRPIEQRFEFHENRIHLSLEALSDLEAEEMVHDVLQRVEAIPQDLVERVVKVTQGRPLFIEEILADMVERGVIRMGAEHWDIDLAGVRDIALPQSVEAAILSRVDALPSASCETLQIASVVGDVCWQGLIMDLGVPEAEIVLQDLEHRQFIKFRHASQIPKESEFYFLLPAVREAVEAHVLRKVKAKLHLSIAEWIDARVNDEHEYFDRLLGHHYHEAGNLTHALPYRLRAGRKAEVRGDTSRALEDLQWVWQQLRGLGGKLPVDPVALGHTRVSVARLLRRSGQHAQAMLAFEETKEMLSPLVGEHPGLDLSLRRAALETARCLIQEGNRQKAADLLEESLKGLKREGQAERMLAAGTIKRQAWLRFLNKQYEDALKLYNEGIDLVEDLGPSPDLASLFGGMGSCYSKMKQAEMAESVLSRALTIEQSVGNIEGQAAAQGNLGVLRYRQGRFEDAVEHFGIARKLNEAIGNLVVAAICRCNTGEAWLELGQASRARDEIKGALAIFRRTRSLAHQADALKTLIRCLHELNDRASEEQRVKELLTLSKEIDQPGIRCTALALACRFAAKCEDGKTLSSHLKDWKDATCSQDHELNELRETVGPLQSELLDFLPADLRPLLAG